MKRVLWVGDAGCSSGFARCTHSVCDELEANDWDVHVLGLNYYGDPHEHPYSIWPCHQPLDGGRDGFGVSRLPRMVERLEPDVIVLLNDPWNVPAYMEVLGEEHPPVVGWMAVDGKNQRGEGLNGLEHLVVWTHFAEGELRRGGYKGSCSIVPLGVDLGVFYPRDRTLSRQVMCPEGLPKDAYIVGYVGRNQPRKRLDLMLDYFGEWMRKDAPENAYLYLHVAPTGDRGVDLRSLAIYHGLGGKVILAEPPIGTGIADERMPLAYSAFDCFWTTTQGEGWGLPVLEAMACGVPCVVPDWSALGDWPGDAVIKVTCSSTAPTAPLNALAYTMGGLADKEETVYALDLLYRDAEMRAEYGEAGRKLAQTLPWSQTAVAFREVLESVVGVPALEAVP